MELRAYHDHQPTCALAACGGDAARVLYLALLHSVRGRGYPMIQRVKANVAQRFDSTRASESELVPLTLVDDDSPRSMSSLDSPSSSMGNKGNGLEGKRLTYVGTPSDTMLSWPAAADAKMSKTRSSSPNDEVRAAPGLRPSVVYIVGLVQSWLICVRVRFAATAGSSQARCQRQGLSGLRDLWAYIGRSAGSSPRAQCPARTTAKNCV